MCVTDTVGRRKSLTFSCLGKSAPLRLPALPKLAQLRHIQGELVTSSNSKAGIAPAPYSHERPSAATTTTQTHKSTSTDSHPEYIRRQAVQHNYHDHASDKPECGPNSPLTSDGKFQRPKAKGGVTTPFPMKLHEMLDEIEKDGHADVISWQPHGRCFVVHKPKEFVDHVMPTYFKQTKIASFQRQLNLYGFNRLTTGADKGGYYHELFLRGKVFLSHKIQRIKVKGTRVRAPCSPDTEPNFYAMPQVIPSPPLSRAAKSAEFKKSSSQPQHQTQHRVLTPPPLPGRIAASPTNAACPARLVKRKELRTSPPPPSMTIATVPPSLVIAARPTYKPRVRPAPCLSASIPMVSPPEPKKQKVCISKDEVDVVMFEGKPFHYLEPFEDNAIQTAPPSKPATAASQRYRISGSFSIAPVMPSLPKKAAAPPRPFSLAPVVSSPPKAAAPSPDMIPSFGTNSFEPPLAQEDDSSMSPCMQKLPSMSAASVSDCSDSNSEQKNSTRTQPPGEQISRQRSSSTSFLIPQEEEEETCPGFPTFKEDVESFFAGFEMPIEQYHEAMSEQDDDIVFGRLLEEAIE